MSAMYLVITSTGSTPASARWQAREQLGDLPGVRMVLDVDLSDLSGNARDALLRIGCLDSPSDQSPPDQCHRCGAESDLRPDGTDQGNLYCSDDVACARRALYLPAVPDPAAEVDALADVLLSHARDSLGDLSSVMLARALIADGYGKRSES